MARTLAVLKGATPAQAIAKYPGSAPDGAGEPRAPRRAAARPAGRRAAGRRLDRRHHLLLARAEASEAGGMLLNYLLGN